MDNWRRIDIDAFDADSGRLSAQDLIPPNQAAVTPGELQSIIQQLRTYATSGDFSSALNLLTTQPPYNADNETKSQYLFSVLDVLTQVRQADIPKLISQLDRQQQDVLVKYLYKGMSIPEGQKCGGMLLAWFEKLTQASGINPIVRFLSDRRTV